jgi:hypothetical protein
MDMYSFSKIQVGCQAAIAGKPCSYRLDTKTLQIIGPANCQPDERTYIKATHCPGAGEELFIYGFNG